MPAAIDNSLTVGDPSIASQANPAGALAFGRQWNLRSISAPAAWSAGLTGSPNVKVAILDTGIDYDSPDAVGLVDGATSASFATRYVRAPTHADSLLDTAQVLARGDNLVRATYFPDRAPYTDFNGHGTNVATQVSSNAFAFAGVSSRTTLMAVKVLGSNGAGLLSSVLNGVLWAADNGADVANLSLGGAFAKSGNGRAVGIINQVLNYAKQKGMLVVVAAGNSGIDLHHDGNLYVNYCDAPHVLCVSAVGLPTWTGNPDAPAFYTNYGKNSIGVAAPGGNGVLDATGHLIPRSDWPWVTKRNPTDIASWVWSLCAHDVLAGFTAANVPVVAGCNTGLFTFASIGTSQAAPHVAGLAALLIAQNGKGNPMKIKTLIENSGDELNPASGGVLGKRINVARALGLIN
jgi:subtilisin family serine protease